MWKMIKQNMVEVEQILNLLDTDERISDNTNA